MTITINYKSGATVKNEAYNVWVENGCLYFTIKSNPSALVVKPTKVPLEVIDTYLIEGDTYLLEGKGEDGCLCAVGTKCGDMEECYSGRCSECSAQ